jgi:hypothetical protein
MEDGDTEVQRYDIEPAQQTCVAARQLLTAE